jgi:hypothetical protein
MGGTLDYPLSTVGNEMSADFGNNTLNDSLLKNHLRSSVIVPDSSKAAYNQGITNSLLQTYAHPAGNNGNYQNILSDRPKTSM